MDYHGIILKLKDRYPMNSTKFHIELMKEAIRQSRGEWDTDMERSLKDALRKVEAVRGYVNHKRTPYPEDINDASESIRDAILKLQDTPQDRITGDLAQVAFDRAVGWIRKNHMRDLDIEVVRDEIMDTTPMHKALEDVVMSILEDNQKSLEFEHYDARANSEEYRKHIKGEAEIDEYLARR